MTREGLVHDISQAPAVAAAVSDTTSDAIIGQDRDGLVSAWNTAAERIFGASREAMIGASFARFLSEPLADRWSDLLAQVASGESVSRAAVTFRRQDDQVVSAALHVTPVRDADGAVVGSVLVVQDRTEQVMAQQTLATAEQRVRRGEIMASAGSFVIDSGDFSEQWSEGMYRIFGVTPERFAETRDAHLDLVHPDDRDAVAAMMTAALTRNVPGELDHRLATTDGATWVFTAVEPFVDQVGRVTGITGFCQDVSVRKRAEATVREALGKEQQVSEELRRLDALKDDFLATVSHELRTPLTSIGGYASLLAKKHPDLGELVGPIERNSAEMSRLVETLLDFCRLTAGQVVLRRQPVALAALIDDCVPGSLAAGPTYLNDVPRDLELVSDPDALRRIVGNLLSNAARYAGPQATVRIATAVETDGSTLLSVADDGPGIAEVHLPRLFERFYQVPDEAARRGTGIGLAIVSEYVERLGGQVWCESTEGAGASFFVRVP